jgi:hypothetical protein
MFSNLGEKARRGLRDLENKIGLDTHKELSNAISESEDVGKAYKNIVAQRDEATKCT